MPYQIHQYVGYRTGVQLSHDVLAVRDDGSLSQFQVIGYLLVYHPPTQQNGNLQFAGTEYQVLDAARRSVPLVLQQRYIGGNGFGDPSAPSARCT